jgi:hypothetical protein
MHELKEPDNEKWLQYCIWFTHFFWGGIDILDKVFYTSPCVQTGSGANPTSYPMGTRGSFPGVKARPERDADHSPPSSAEAKNE